MIFFVLTLLTAVAALATMDAIGVRRTRDNDIAWHCDHYRSQLIAVARHADRLAAQGHPDPGTAALAAYHNPD